MAGRHSFLGGVLVSNVDLELEDFGAQVQPLLLLVDIPLSQPDLLLQPETAFLSWSSSVSTTDLVRANTPLRP